MPPSVPLPDTQKLQITQLEQTYDKLKAGQTWYVVSSKWWEAWLGYVESQNRDPPGPVDNHDLVANTGKLKQDLIENDHYVLKPSKIWKLLKEWYGIKRNDKKELEFSGTVVKNPKDNELFVELFPMRVALTVHPRTAVPSQTKAPRKVSISRYLLMNQIVHTVVSKLHLVADRKGARSTTELHRVWLKSNEDADWKLVREDDDTIVNETLPTSVTWELMLEIRASKKDPWPRGTGNPAEEVKDDEDEDDGPSEVVGRAAATSIDMGDPSPGEMLDAKRTKDGKWYEASVQSVEVDEGTVKVTVHFLTFDKKQDEVFDVTSDSLAPPHTHVRDWRTQLKVDEEVEVHRKVFTGTSKLSTTAWHVGKVKKFDRDSKNGEMPGGRVMVRVKTGTMWNSFKDYWVPVRSELLAGRTTHLARTKPTWGPSAQSGKPTMTGIVGLRNLGNTCFMNSMLQCLSHTIPVSEFFLSGDYRKDINRKNPLGAGGELAEAYGNLLEQIWSDSFKVVVPSDFKRVLGSHFSQFQGYQQQDSHELFSLLVDGLHEDLNRIRNKPITEAVEGEGRPDAEIAKESWDVFRLRNDSIIVDRMMGMMRSHLTCPDCKTEALKFDPYSNWSVPVPALDEKTINLVFMRLVEDEVSNRTSVSSKSLLVPKPRHFQAVRYSVNVPRRGTGKHLAIWLSKKTGISVQDIVIMELWNNKHITWYFSPSVDQQLRNIKEDDDLVAYQLVPSQELKAWRRCSKKGPQANTLGGMPTNSIDADTDPIWDELRDMYIALGSPEELVNKWWKSCCVNADAEHSQRVLVAKLRSEKLPAGGVSFKYPKKVAEKMQDKVTSKKIPVVDELHDWVAYENGVGNPVADKVTEDKLPIAMPMAHPIANMIARNAEPGAKARLLGPQLAHASAQQLKRGSVSAGGVVPVEVQHTVDGKPAYIRCFRAPDVVSFLPDATWNEVHQTVWRHVKWMLKDDYQVPQSFLRKFGGDLSDPSETAKMRAAGQASNGEEAPPPYVLNRDVSSYSANRAVPFGTDPSEISNDTLVIEWTPSGSKELQFPPRPETPTRYGTARAAPVKEGEPSPRDLKLNVGPIQIDETAKALMRSRETGASGKPVIHLSHCLDKFRQREQLSENDEWYCPKCKNFVRAHKKMDLWTIPDVLVIHLKRFMYERSMFRATVVHRDKITDPISFPITGLDISEYVMESDSKKDAVYDLYGVSNHIGSMGGGHYTAYVKNQEDGKWYNMDDSRTSEVPVEEVCSPKAYVLFYKRRS